MGAARATLVGGDGRVSLEAQEELGSVLYKNCQGAGPGFLVAELWLSRLILPFSCLLSEIKSHLGEAQKKVPPVGSSTSGVQQRKIEEKNRLGYAQNRSLKA